MRKPKKITDKQKQILSAIINELKAIYNTNDLGSPTHGSDINNFLNAYYINDKIKDNLVNDLRDILTQIKYIKDD